jgi:hypothetical protein
MGIDGIANCRPDASTGSVRLAVNPFVLFQFEARDFSIDPRFVRGGSQLQVLVQ